MRRRRRRTSGSRRALLRTSTSTSSASLALDVTAHAGRLDHSLDSDQISRLAQRDPLLLGSRRDVAVGLAHDAAELVVHLSLGPAEVLEVLHPLEVGADH